MDESSIILQMKMGTLTLEIKILKVYLPTDIFSRSTISKGAFGKIYEYEFKEKKYIIKSQHLSLQDRE